VLQVGQRVSFALANLGNQEYEATVKSIGKTVEESARTIRVMAEFRNTSPVILPGMFVTAEIHTDEQNLDALPEEAIVSENDKPYLFYTTTNDGSTSYEFFRLPVKTGFREEGMVQVEVMAPLPAHARIVVKGTYFIQSESLKSSE
jgi:cobalt-zinc-cadmium efflux system membrane fusion protein